MNETIHEREHMVGVQEVQVLQQIQEHFVDLIHLQAAANTTFPTGLSEIRNSIDKALERGAEGRKRMEKSAQIPTLR